MFTEAQSDSLHSCFGPPVASCLVHDKPAPARPPLPDPGNTLEHHPWEVALPSQHADAGLVPSLARPEVGEH